MLARIRREAEVDQNFVVNLTTSDVENHLAGLARGREQWAGSHRSEVELVRQITTSGVADWSAAGAIQVAEGPSDTVIR